MEDLTSSSFLVTIPSFSKLENPYYSNTFRLSGYNWRLLILPKGNNVDHVPIYIHVADEADMPRGWSIYAQFSIAVVNRVHTHCTLQKDTRHTFSAEESLGGFEKFMPLSDLYDPVKRFLENDTLIVEVVVASRYDSEVVTGCVGLGSEGQTSYANSLLQTLYHMLCFRKEIAADGIMQQLLKGHHTTYIECINLNYNSMRKDSFYDLQLDVKGCPDVYASFDKYVEVECLEGDNKYHTGELGLQDVRKGIRFLDFPPVLQLQLKRFEYDSARDMMIKMKNRYEFPMDLDLDKESGKYLSPVADRRVRNLFMLHSVLVHSGGEHGGCCHAFIRPTLSNQWFKFDDKTVTEEDNKRFLEELYGGEEEMNNGLHDTPLKHPEYSNPYMLVYVRKSDMEKIICNMGEQDFAEHLRVRLSKDKEETGHKEKEASFYNIIKVVHFHSLEKPNKEEFCLELSEIFTYDKVVEKVACRLGLDNPSKVRLTSHNCYTLQPKPIPIQYRSPIHLSDMLAHGDLTSDILYYEVLEEHHYRIVKITRNEDLVQQIGRNIYFDLVDHENVFSFRIQRTMTFYTFKEEVAMEFGIPVQSQRYWLWARRQNHTYRPHRPLTPEEETQSVGELREISRKDPNSELNLFLEVGHGVDSRPFQPPVIRKKDILLFFKLYDPVKEELRYVGRLFVESTKYPFEIFGKLRKMAGFSSEQEILLYEEIRFDTGVMCDMITRRLPFHASHLENGDIVCFQKYPVLESARYPLIPSFLEYVLNCQVVQFCSLEKPKEDGFSLEISRVSIYDDVAGKVACKLRIYDPSRIRFTDHDSSSQGPKATHIECRGMDKLSDILVNYNKETPRILYYEILEEKPESSSSAQNRPSTCVICLIAPTEGACIPCGHMACCMSCLSEIQGKGSSCPVCRAEVQQVVKIFAV